MPERTTIPRAASRVLVSEPGGRILLMGVVLPNTGLRIWFPPGGGAEVGEDPVDAARRELLEETGLVVTREQLGAAVARSSGHWTGLDGTVYAASDTYFAIVVSEFTPDVSRFTELEREIGAYFRWWTADEVEATADTVYPVGLSSLMRRLATGERPVPALDLPWS